MEGFDDQGKKVGNIETFWKSQGIDLIGQDCAEGDSRQEWYGKSSDYWDVSIRFLTICVY